MANICDKVWSRCGRMSAMLLACVFAVLGMSRTFGANVELIDNGDMERLSDGRPQGWGGTMVVENGNHFLRLVQQTPGDMPMVYRRVDLPKDLGAYEQIDLSMRGRVTGLVKGVESWYDARVMINVKSADGKTLSSPNISFGKDTGWTERHTYIKLSAGAAYLEIMPTLFRVNAGTFDFDDFHAVFVDPTGDIIPPVTTGLGAADMLHVD